MKIIAVALAMCTLPACASQEMVNTFRLRTAPQYAYVVRKPNQSVAHDKALRDALDRAVAEQDRNEDR